MNELSGDTMPIRKQYRRYYAKGYGGHQYLKMLRNTASVSMSIKGSRSLAKGMKYNLSGSQF